MAIGVTSEQPVPTLPGVPPIASVLPGYVAESWFVLVAPAGTPQPIIDKLSAEVDRILKKPEVAERFAKLGATPVGGTPKQLGDFIAASTLFEEALRLADPRKDLFGLASTIRSNWRD